MNILTKLCFGRAIGVYFCGERVCITDTGITIKGLTILNQQSFETAGSSLTNILQEYIKNHGGKNASICLGLKPEQMFFITSRAENEQEEQIRDKLLDHAGFHSAEERNTVVADYLRINKTKSSSGPLCSIGVCKKQLASELHTAINEAGFTDFLLKPTPWSMAVYSSSKLPKKCKSWKVFVQVFLNETGGLAVLMLEKHPVCWKRFTSTPESVDKIISAIRSIFLQSTVTLSHPMVDGIILWGANAEQLSEKLYNSLGIEIVIADGPGFTDSFCSHSLAMSAKAKDVAQFDMFHELRAKPSIMQIFPWKNAAAVAVMALVMGFIMWQKASELTKAYETIKKQNSAYVWAQKKNTQEIVKARKALMDETEAIGKFITTRIIWSDYLRDLPTRLPSNVGLSNLWALCEYHEAGAKETGKTKESKSLAMRGITLFEKGKAAPQQIETFMESLRKVDLLQRDFPKVQLAEVRWRREGISEIAMFTVQALPKKADKGSGGEKGAKGEAAKGSAG
ncbi:MAG: hypothetical protein ABSE89_01285 [Sedimentisphaerales bacterium]